MVMSAMSISDMAMICPVLFMLPGILAGFIFGRRLTATPSLLYKLLGGIVIFFAVFNFIQLMRGKELRKPGKAASAATLLAAGTVHGFFVCGGPLLVTYAAGQMPCVYDDFIEEAKPLLTHEHRNNLRKLLDFRFRRHRLYNLPEQRLELIEAVVHEQARKLLKER